MGSPSALVAGEASGPVEEGEGAVWILVHADGGLDVVRSGRAGGDLEDPSFVAHGVVVSDHTLFLTTEDVILNPAVGRRADCGKPL